MPRARGETVGKAIHFHAFRGERERLGVPVDADQAGVGACFEERCGMPGEAEGAIHRDRAGLANAGATKSTQSRSSTG